MNLRRKKYTLIAFSAIALIGIGFLVTGVFTRDNDNTAPLVSSSDNASDSALDEQGGFISEDTPISPHDNDHPAISNLNQNLKTAIQQAARDAEKDGVKLHVTSGWRSRAYQQQLFDQAVITYGSEQEARRNVSTPDTSRHVTGDAVDIGPTDGLSWLSQVGNQYGLCQTYGNEMWHYELAITPGGVCPQMKTDASE